MTLAFSLTLLTTLLLVAGIIYYGLRKPGYSHQRHTISELGEQNSVVARWVNYGLFLPVGVLLWLVATVSSDKEIAKLALCVGAGYVIAAFFPSDVGSPSSGSWRQQIHNLGGAVEYLGGAYWLSQVDTSTSLFGYPLTTIGAGAVLAGTFLISIDTLAWRGWIQRLVECILFGSLLAATYSH